MCSYYNSVCNAATNEVTFWSTRFNQKALKLFSLTLFALQSHSGLKIIHLHLQTLQSEVILVWLPSVGQQDNNDDDEEQPSSSCDAEDGREG